MSLAEIQNAVAELSYQELCLFARWFEEHFADEWDKQIESDAASGKFDKIAARAEEDFKAGRCTPL